MISKLSLRSIAGGMKTILKPTLNLLCTSPCYNFAQVPSKIQGKGKLIQALDKEIKYEEENYSPEQSAREFIVSKGFEVKDVADEYGMEIYKKIGGTTVTIQFQPKQLKSEDEIPEDQQDEYQGMMPDDFFEFTVLLTRKDNLTMAYECLLAEGEVEIDNAKVIYDVASYTKAPRLTRNFSIYGGPQVYTLDEDLKNNLYDYLEAFGVNAELLAKVEEFAYDREQRLYMRWLKQVRDFVDEAN
mmetsp:Transcript_72289/g.83970  ORF Transcript_72289/g.83970 Transcript_72289/m.83970 type:complete len:243 (+) Transcript_72289:53-781(+)